MGESKLRRCCVAKQGHSSALAAASNSAGGCCCCGTHVYVLCVCVRVLRGVDVAMVCCAPPAAPRQTPGRRSGNYRLSSAALAKLALCVHGSGEALSPEPPKLELGLARPSLGLGTRRIPGRRMAVAGGRAGSRRCSPRRPGSPCFIREESPGPRPARGARARPFLRSCGGKGDPDVAGARGLASSVTGLIPPHLRYRWSFMGCASWAVPWNPPLLWAGAGPW